MLLDASLAMEAHVAATARSAFYHLQLVRQLVPFLRHNDLATVIHTMVTLRPDYCNALYMGLPLSQIRKLQLV